MQINPAVPAAANVAALAASPPFSAAKDSF
jgi:hypothetical protein